MRAHDRIVGRTRGSSTHSLTHSPSRTAGAVIDSRDRNSPLNYLVSKSGWFTFLKMSSLEHLTFLTFLSAATVITIVCGGFYLSMRTFPRHRLAGQVLSVTIALAIASIFSVGLNQLWSAKRDRDARVWTARRQHLEGLQH